MRISRCSEYGVIIADDVMEKIRCLTEICDVEISGLGTIFQTQNGNLVVDNLYVFNQRCTGVSTRLNQEDVSMFYTKMIEDGKEEDLNRMLFWWHSHVDMGVFWSFTDIQNIQNLNNSDYLVSMVSNKRGQHKLSIKFKNPSLLLDDILFDVHKTGKNLENIYEECILEVNEKVTQ